MSLGLLVFLLVEPRDVVFLKVWQVLEELVVAGDLALSPGLDVVGLWLSLLQEVLAL